MVNMKKGNLIGFLFFKKKRNVKHTLLGYIKGTKNVEKFSS